MPSSVEASSSTVGLYGSVLPINLELERIRMSHSSATRSLLPESDIDVYSCEVATEDPVESFSCVVGPSSQHLSCRSFMKLSPSLLE
jgi:hypothetical protein